MFDILLVTGAAGSGKTSTARAWAASRQGKAAHLSHDEALGFMKSGFVSPAAEDSAEAEGQWRLALEVCVAASRVYGAAGVQCAIDTFLLPSRFPLWAGLEPLRVGVTVLQPPVEVALGRNAARLKSHGWGVPDWQVRANHEAMVAWQENPDVLVLDNAQLDLAQIVAAIDAWAEART